MTWLQTRLSFQKFSEDAFSHLQKQKRITKECFFPVAKEENVLEPHFNYCREVFPTKMICLSRNGKSLFGDDTDQHFCQEYQVLWAWHSEFQSILEFQHKARGVLNSQISIRKSLGSPLAQWWPLFHTTWTLAWAPVLGKPRAALTSLQEVKLLPFLENFFYASTYVLIISGYKKLGKFQQSIHSCPLVDWGYFHCTETLQEKYPTMLEPSACSLAGPEGLPDP